MWEKIKTYGNAMLHMATDFNTVFEFAEKKNEEHHDLNNTYNKELLEYTKNIRSESNDEKNWDHTRPLNAQEAMEEAEKCLNADIERYMNSDDIKQRAFGYKMKMDHYDDLLRSARTEEERNMINEAKNLEDMKVRKKEEQIQNSYKSPQNNKPIEKKEKNDMTNDQIDSQIKALQDQITQLQKLKK